MHIAILLHISVLLSLTIFLSVLSVLTSLLVSLVLLPCWLHHHTRSFDLHWCSFHSCCLLCMHLHIACSLCHLDAYVSTVHWLKLLFGHNYWTWVCFNLMLLYLPLLFTWVEHVWVWPCTWFVSCAFCFAHTSRRGSAHSVLQPLLFLIKYWYAQIQKYDDEQPK